MVEAVIQSGSKQYRVKEGDTVTVEKLGDAKTVTLKPLLVTTDGKLGNPAKATVKATVTDQVKGEKLIVFKMKPKKRSRRKNGHRQTHSLLKIDKITV